VLRFSALVLSLVAVCSASTTTLACVISTNQRSLFFHRMPAALDAPAIARVTVTQVRMGNAGREQTQFAVGQVEQVIKGDIEQPVVWMPFVRTSCGPHVEVGMQGIVFGTLRRAPDGSVELLPIERNLDGKHFQSPYLEGRNP